MSSDAQATPLMQPEVEAIPSKYRAGAAQQLAALRLQARLVEDFVVAHDLDPAPLSSP
ncbi:MAG: hypothetical protein ABIQ86_07535 [Steroidobacteraceae bacterium]